MDDLHLRMLQFFCRHSDDYSKPVVCDFGALSARFSVTPGKMSNALNSLKLLGYIKRYDLQMEDGKISIELADAGRQAVIDQLELI